MCEYFIMWRGPLLSDFLVESFKYDSFVCAFSLQPAALLGFVGLGVFVHYNDERRAIPKGTSFYKI